MWRGRGEEAEGDKKKRQIKLRRGGRGKEIGKEILSRNRRNKYQLDPNLVLTSCGQLYLQTDKQIGWLLIPSFVFFRFVPFRSVSFLLFSVLYIYIYFLKIFLFSPSCLFLYLFGNEFFPPPPSFFLLLLVLYYYFCYLKF